MKSFYDEYFRIPKEGSGKITDKVMLVKVAQIVATMVFCLLAMSLSAYAYFSHNVTSGTNVIQSADFGLNVTITESETDISAGEGGIYQLGNGTYTVTLTKKGTASTGFGVIEVTVGETTVKYHTQQLGVGGVLGTIDEPPTLTFTLDLSALPVDETATIKITPHWGTSIYYNEYNSTTASQYYITNNSTVNVTVGSVSIITDEGDTSESPTPTEKVHIVTKEDTLTSISKTYGVSVDRIIAYNNIADPDVIETGQRIVIPPDDWMPSDDDE